MALKSRILVPLHAYFWRFKLTPAGRAMVVAMLLSALGSVTVEIPVYQLMCGLLVLLAVTEPVGTLLRPHVQLDGRLPDRARVNETFTGEIRITNRSWRPALDVMLGLFGLPREIRREEGDRFVPVLAAGESAELPVSLKASRRGLYRLPAVHAHSTFPFNLMRFGACRLPPQSVTILPRYHSLRSIEIPHSQRYQPGGVSLAAHVGDAMEYIGNREYHPGEPARRMDFRAWARLGKPIVREFQEEYSCRIALILDTHIPGARRPGPNGFPSLEAGVSLMAAVAEALSTGDYLIDLFAAGPQLHVFRTSGSRESFDSVLEILASVDASRTDPFEQVSPAVVEEMSRISTAVCILLDWEPARQRLAGRILEAGCALKVIILRDAPTTLPVDSLGAEIQCYSIDEVNRGMVEEL
jgi:uncharacterized protein (DUF58 family)